MVVFKKNQIVTVAMVCLLILAGYLNFIYKDKEENLAVANKEVTEEKNYGEAEFVSSSKDTKLDYFNETKENKEKARSKALEIVKNIVENENATKEEKIKAEKEIMKMAEAVTKESNIENILMGKGLQKVSAYINDKGITIAVLTKGLKPDEVAKIRDVVLSETDISASNIKIMEIK